MKRALYSLSFLLLASVAALANTIEYHELDLYWTDGRFQQFGPFVDYDFFWSFYPTLLAEEANGDLRTFGYIACYTIQACTPVPVVLVSPPPAHEPPVPTGTPEPSTLALTAGALAWIYRKYAGTNYRSTVMS